MPVYATVFMLFMMASVGLPGTSGFVGEILVIVGAFQYSTLGRPVRRHRHDPGRRLHAVALPPGRLRRAWSRTRCSGIRDMRTNEVIAFAPLVVLAIVMGVYPSLFLDPMHASVNQLLAQIGVAGTDLALR